MIPNKKLVFNRCLEEVNAQIDKYKEELENIKESMVANDVHTDYDEEGSKGELLGDFEKYAQYLDNAQSMKQVLNRVDREHYSEHIKFGSIFETEKHFYFIAIPLGDVVLDDGSTVHVISTDAPIYEQLEGKKAGDKFILKDKEVEIEEVH